MALHGSRAKVSAVCIFSESLRNTSAMSTTQVREPAISDDEFQENATVDYQSSTLLGK